MLGEGRYYYFHPQRVEEIRQTLGLPRVDDASIRELFLDFVARMDMSSSYKPVMLLAILDKVDEHGRAALDEVVRAFHAFYLDRLHQSLPVERAGMRMQQPQHLALEDVRSVMLNMPFRKFEQRKYLSYDQDVAYIRLERGLWRQLVAEDLSTLRARCRQAISEYYERIPT
jgi:hypothetical protein